MTQSFSNYYEGPCPVLDMDQQEYKGRRVTWLGTSGLVLKIPSEYISSRVDNITDPRKVKAVTTFIRQATPSITLSVSVADIRFIDLSYVQMTQEAHYSDILPRDFGLEEPFTTGDEEQDLFVADPKRWLESHHYSEDFINEEGVIQLAAIEDREDPEDVQDIYDTLVAQVTELRAGLQDSCNNKEGDLGNLWAVMRDGNHRTLGAIRAGEPYIYVKPLYYNPTELQQSSYFTQLI
jgi:hypothetical protein